MAEEDKDPILIFMGINNIGLAILFAYYVVHVVARSSIYCDPFLGYWLLGASIVYILTCIFGGVVGVKGHFNGIIGFFLLKLLIVVGLFVVLLFVLDTTGGHGDTQQRLWQARVGTKWGKTKNCLVKASICQADQALKNPFNECCTRPSTCEAQNESSSNRDCVVWSVSSTRLCYDCLRCKVAVFNAFIYDWDSNKIVWIGCLAAFVTSYIVELSVHIGWRQDKRKQLQAQRQQQQV